MEENKEGSQTSCGMRCGCCCCKAIKAIVLLLVGGIIGFLIGHGGHGCCPVAMNHPAATAPAATAPAAPAPAPKPAPKPAAKPVKAKKK